MIHAKEDFFETLTRDLYPLLRADGFKGSGGNFWRVVHERIDTLNVQGSKYGDECAVNLGSHYAFLPAEGGVEVLEPKRFRPWHCVFRDRLHNPEENDHWWPYGSHATEAAVSARDLVDTYRRRGVLFFRRLEPFPDVFLALTPEQIAAGRSPLPWGAGPVRAALTMARIMKHLGRTGSCRQFAEAGVREASPYLVPEFLELLRHD